MNIPDMLSKMNPQMLANGLKQISQGLSAEQLKQAEATIKNSGAVKGLEDIDLKTLQENPQKLKDIVGNKALIEQLQAIINKK